MAGTMEIAGPGPVAAETRRRERDGLLAGAVGNLLEWYDFAIYGYFGAILGRAFFPAENPTTSLLSALAVFAAAFFMRPLGGILFGHIGDRYGRGRALVLSAGLMTVSTVAMGCLPTYETAGLAAPVLLVVLRLAQGLSVGGEYTSSVIFLVERSPARRRGLFGSFACSSSGGGMLLGSLAGVLVTSLLDPAEVAAWGWRIPFLLGLGLGLFILVLRRNLGEEAAPVARATARSPLREALASEGGTMLRAGLITMAPAAAFYIAFVYLVTFLQSQDGVTEHAAFLLNTVAMLMVIGATPLIAALSDRVGRKRLLTVLTAGLAVAAWPLFSLIDTRSWPLILAGQAGFAVLVGGILAVLPATLVEMTRARTRCTAMAVSFNAAMALFGGTAPMVAAALVQRAGLPTSPGLYIAVLAALSLVAVTTLRDRTGQPLA
ncbi:MFS transporter [uncultured Methylobacterium sp.]|jgi:MHS family proline/betaine transporter-like MFS transporter|uniref:MFS transporter n=1 Tax=uncultured Methylobacterium sp. TaxID=157278 RepID=UPI002627D316|nr:MFS transporter [uncultured Methylobacterium sp.]